MAVLLKICYYLMLVIISRVSCFWNDTWLLLRVRKTELFVHIFKKRSIGYTVSNIQHHYFYLFIATVLYFPALYTRLTFAQKHLSTENCDEAVSHQACILKYPIHISTEIFFSFHRDRFRHITSIKIQDLPSRSLKFEPEKQKLS